MVCVTERSTFPRRSPEDRKRSMLSRSAVHQPKKEDTQDPKQQPGGFPHFLCLYGDAGFVDIYVQEIARLKCVLYVKPRKSGLSASFSGKNRLGGLWKIFGNLYVDDYSFCPLKATTYPGSNTIAPIDSLYFQRYS
jgi:hypothetical protein